MRVVLGNSPYSSEHKDVAGYCKVPNPVRSQEPREIHLRRVQEKVDIGYRVHERVHKDFGIELVTRFNDALLLNTIVVLKVQTPVLVGGIEDRYNWNQRDYDNRKYPKHPSFLDCKKMMLTPNYNNLH